MGARACATACEPMPSTSTSGTRCHCARTDGGGIVCVQPSPMREAEGVVHGLSLSRLDYMYHGIMFLASVLLFVSRSWARPNGGWEL